MSERRAACGMRRVGEERTHKYLSFVSWLNTSGTVPLILFFSKCLRMCARKCEGKSAVSERRA